MVTTYPYDVVVIGGGPAGAAAATLLQRRGHRCLVLEGATFPRYHIGESLIPQTYGTLERLGLLPRLRASHFPVKHSVRFVSPSGHEAAPFYFAETLSGERARTWQVERSEFDQMCLDNARESGVEVRAETRVTEVLFEDERAVGVRVRSDDRSFQDVPARVVIDASGRSTVIGNQLRLKREVPGLRKGTVWSYFRGGSRAEGIDAGETVVFMLPDRGWFWYIPLPGDIVSVGIVASPEYLFRESQDFEEIFSHEVERCRPLKERLSQAVRTQPARGLHKLAYLNRRVVGDGWVLVGDAAGFLDPIYSSGLFLALGSAELAADAIHEALLTGDVSADRLGTFVAPLWRGIEVIYRLIQAFYDPDFSFRDFGERFPEQRPALIRCLIGDVVGRDMSSFLDALSQMTPAPVPLHEGFAAAGV
jgi:flavin-dependent dehydrogenase